MEEESAQSASNVESGAVRFFVSFFLTHLKQELLRILGEPDPGAPYAVPVSVLLLAQHSPEVAELLLRSPKPVLGYMDQALITAQHSLLAKSPAEDNLCLKEAARARLTGLPSASGGCLSPGIGQIRSAHAGSLIVACGTVTRTGAVKVLESERHYECSRCGHQFVVKVDMEAEATIQLPQACPAKKARPCKGRSFRHLTEFQRHSDFQEIRIQERSQSLAVGAMPRSIDLIAQDDLVDTCQPGDDVEVVAMVSRRWRASHRGGRCDVDLVLMANNLAIANARKASFEVSREAAAVFERFWEEHAGCRLRGRNRVLASLCPQIHGLFLAKLATLVMLIGGMQRVDESGTRVRGEVHMLIVGDPGTGKSQFLKYAAKLSSRAVITSGKGSSAAGLTATAVREGQHWALEAGAMVLADGGICCIDEFDGLKEGVRATIHEAMEQQTVSVAKAGLLTTLNTRTTVFGVTNPKGTYDPRESLAVNTSLSGPLLSRFDIVLVLRDQRNVNWDEAVADHILNGAESAEGDATSTGWDLSMLQQYICWVKGFRPRMSPEAEAILLQYYQLQRRSGCRDAARTTIRMLESLVRIAQAHARLLAREEVTQQDAVFAVALVDASMVESAIMQSMLHLPFPEDPEVEFVEMEERLLSMLRAKDNTLLVPDSALVTDGVRQ